MTSTVCHCLKHFHSVCKEASRIVLNSTHPPSHHHHSHKEINLHIVHDSADEAGRIAYTVSILLIFSLIIIVLMFRSIKRSSSTVEMEALLDAMRFREELDLQQRQKRRLMKAKTKVTAWLTRANQNENRGWKSTPALLPIRKRTTSSMVSEVPEIVVTDDIHRSHTPALSLIYNFEGSGTARSSVVSTGNSLFSTSLDSTCSRKRSLHPDFHSNSLPDA